MKYKKEKTVAIDAVLKASELCKRVQKNLISEDSKEKKDKSPVTIADFGAQAIIIHELKKVFPNDPIVAEEDARELTVCGGDTLREKVVNSVQRFLPDLTEEQVVSSINQGNYEGGNSGRFWTLDPIDGTKGFLRKEQYAVALALIENGEVVLGVLGCPNLEITFDRKGSYGALFFAEKAKGAYLKLYDTGVDLKIQVSGEEQASKASFCESVESSHSSHSDSAKIAEILGVTKEPVRIDSQCKYGILARGDASIYLRLPTKKDYREKIWDHAAGYIIVKEAGGEVTDCNGKPLDFSLGKTLEANTGIVGTNGRIHDEVVKVVKEVVFQN